MNRNYSVALCCYNGAKYIEQQLRSIIGQTVPPTQIVVSDDGSKDDTLAIVHRVLDESGIDSIIAQNDGEHGVVPNFMNAMCQCNSDIIFTSDQDDVWMPNKAEEMLKVFESDSQAMLVLCDGDLVDASLNSLNCSTWQSVGITTERQQKQDWFAYLLQGPLVTGAGMAIRKRLLGDIDTIPSAWLHDGWLGWAAVIRGGFRICPQRLFLYRQHGSNVEGMDAQNKLTRIGNWFNNMNKMEDVYNTRFQRYDSLWQKWGNRFNAQQQKELKQCRNFWYALTQLKEHSRLERIMTVRKLYLCGAYDRYYTSTRGMVRDLMLSLR